MNEPNTCMKKLLLFSPLFISQPIALAVLLLTLFFSGCGPRKSYMTTAVRKQLDNSNFDMSNTKFYTGLKIRVSSRQYLHNVSRSSGNSVSSSAAELQDKLVITPKVPGRLLKVSGDTLFVDFDGSGNTIPFIPTKSGSYGVAGLSEWKKDREPITKLENIDWVSTIRYGGNICKVETVWPAGIAPLSELVIEGKIKTKVAKSKKKAKGAW